MDEKDLLVKLNNSKKLVPDRKWLASNRELFLTQIANSGADKLSIWQGFYINFKSFARASAQPVFASLIFLFVLVSSSIFGHKLFSEAKPNDTLYIARVISEKAKLNTVLDSETRNDMAVKFAAQHARDISQVLSDPEFNNKNNKDRVEKLNASFDRELERVEDKINTNKEEATNENEIAVRQTDNEEEVFADNQTETIINEEGNNESEEDIDEEGEVLIAADTSKEENGLQLYLTENEDEKEIIEEEVVNKATSSDLEEKAGSSTKEIAGALLEEIENGQEKIDSALIEEVRLLFQAKDYQAVILKLNQIISK